ncbi:MAG: HEAT repeat domain-containing protein [Candidatus Riflebacteria bacterium]|nr:HEAT repeat domain-containing protein [Candidatus Riflebacteria bacterium]
MDRRIQELVLDLSSELEDVRKCAVMWLAQLEDPSVLPHLEKMVKDPEVSVRYFARRAITQLQRASVQQRQSAPSSEGVQQVLAMLTSPDARVRLRGALACYDRNDPELLGSLVHCLDAETDVRVIATLVKAVGSQGKPAAIPRMLSMLHHPDARVRANAVEALTPFEDASIFEAVGLLAMDRDNRVRSNVAIFFSKRSPDKVQLMLHGMIATGLLWMKDSAVYVMRTIAAPWCLADLEELALAEGEGSPLSRKLKEACRHVQERLTLAPNHGLEAPSTPSLTGPADAAPDDLRNVRALLATQRTPLTKDFPELETVADFDDHLSALEPERRIHALQNADAFPREIVLSRLRALSQTESNLFVQATLAKALGRLGTPEDLPALGEYLKSADARVRANAVEGLCAFGSDEALALVDAVKDDASPRVQANLAIAFAKRDTRRALAALEAMIASPDVKVAESALYGLKNVGTHDCLGILELALKRDEPSIQLKALGVLDALGASNPAAKELFERYRQGELAAAYLEDQLAGLFAKMNQRDAQVRLEALELLAKLDDEHARLRIELAMNDTAEPVRQRAAVLLQAANAADEERRIHERLGMSVFKLAQSGGLPDLGLAAEIEELRGLGTMLDHGADPKQTLALRNQTLTALGKKVMGLFHSGQVPSGFLAQLCGRTRKALEELRTRGEAPPAGAVAGGPTTPGADLSGGALMPAARPRPAAPHASRSSKATALPPAPPPLYSRAIENAKAYVWLIASAALALVTVIILARGAMGPGPAETSKLTLATVAIAPDAGRYRGKQVAWNGTVREINPSRNRLLAESGGHFFVVKSEVPFSEPLGVGSAIQADGVIVDRKERGVVFLSGSVQVLGAGVAPPR